MLRDGSPCVIGCGWDRILQWPSRLNARLAARRQLFPTYAGLLACEALVRSILHYEVVYSSFVGTLVHGFVLGLMYSLLVGTLVACSPASTCRCETWLCWQHGLVLGMVSQGSYEVVYL